MGTRSCTVIKDGKTTLVTMYSQFDGYPEGHGKELGEFLKDFTIVNGYGEKLPKLANGAGCLAAQIIAHFKDGVGGFYLVAPSKPGANNDEWYYEVSVVKNKVTVKVTEVGWGDTENKVWFEGSSAELLEYISGMEA